MLARTPDPWIEGTYLLPGSADGQPCIYGDERELPLVVFDADDPEAAGNCRLMSLAGALLENSASWLTYSGRIHRIATTTRVKSWSLKPAS